MKALTKIGASLAALAMPSAAFAVDMQYVVHNAFDESVAAFQRLALITGDSTYIMIAGCMVAVSLLFAVLLFSAKGMAKEASNPMGFLIQGAAGLALFAGAVMPKGTLYVYDDVLNKNQAVGGIPQLVVFAAGASNAIEREVSRIVDTAAATPYGTDIGATTYQLLYALSRGKQSDADLERTIGQYVKDCGLTAIGTAQNGTTMNELLRNSTDLKVTLEKYRHPSWPTTYYPQNNSGGVPGVCDDAWNYINGRLGSGAGTPAAELSDQACRESGFNTSDSQAASRCDAIELEAAKQFGIAPSTSAVFINNFIISQGIKNMMMSSEFAATQSVLVNRQMIAEGMGASEALNQWVPRLRALMMVLFLGILPIPLLFVASQLVYKATGIVLGLFVMMTMWGICDAISVQAARDAAATVFASLKNQHVGYEAMMLVPTASMQALAMYGKYRMAAMGISFALTAALFKFSASSFGKSSEVAGEELTSKGGQAGLNTLTPEGVQSTMGSLDNSSSSLAANLSYGAGNVSGAAAQGGLRSASGQAEIGRYVEAMAGGPTATPEGVGMFYQGINDRVGAGAAMDPIGAANANADIAERRGGTVGSVAREASTARNTFSNVENLSRSDSANELFGAQGLQKSAEFSGNSSSAVNAADMDLASLKQGDTPVQKLEALREQERASTKGLALAEPSNGAIVDSFKTEQTQRLGRLGEVAKHGPRDVGAGQGAQESASGLGAKKTESDVGFGGMVEGSRYSGDLAAQTGKAAHKYGGGVPGAAATVATGNMMNSVVGAKATANVWNKLGPAAMVKGEEFGKAGSAYTGAAAQEAGGLYSIAKETRENDLANSIGASRVSTAIGEQFGLNPDHIKDRVNVSQMKQGVVGMVLDEKGKAVMADQGLANGTFNAQQAEALRNSPGTSLVNFGIDKDGRIGSIKADSLSNVTSGKLVTDSEGLRLDHGDRKAYGNTTTAGDSFAVNSPLMFGGNDFGASAKTLAQLIPHAAETGKLGTNERAVLAQTLSQRLSQEGNDFKADDNSQGTTSYSVGGGFGASAGVGPTANPGSAARSAGSPRFGGSLSAGVNSQTINTQSDSVSTNIATAKLDSAIGSNWAQANLATESVYGHRSTWSPEKKAEATDYMLKQFAGRNEQSMNELRSLAVDRTAGRVATATGPSEFEEKVTNPVSSTLGKIKDALTP